MLHHLWNIILNVLTFAFIGFLIFLYLEPEPDIEGRLHFVPNGQITTVTNRSYEWSRAMLDVPVPYSCDVDRAMEILMDEANEFCEDMNYTAAVADRPEMLGVNEFAESAIIIRFYIKTAADMQMPVKREMLRRIKKRFDREGISIPYPHRVVVSEDPRQEKPGAAAD